jgi:hypothetical protein
MTHCGLAVSGQRLLLDPLTRRGPRFRLLKEQLLLYVVPTVDQFLAVRNVAPADPPISVS